MYTFTAVDNPAACETLTARAQTPFATSAWLQYLYEFRGATPCVIQIAAGDDYVGYFPGSILKIGPLKMFGSPLMGLRTPYMGFNLERDADLPVLVDELVDFISGTLNCNYISFCDRQVSQTVISQCRHAFIAGGAYETYLLDLTKSEEELFKNFKHMYRTNVRKFDSTGCRVEHDHSDAFIKTHNDQLKEVYEKDGIAAPDITRQVEAIFRNTAGKMLLSIKAVSPDGVNIASSYYLYQNKLAAFGSNASYREHLAYRPNQGLMWYAIKYLKNLGIETLDLSGADEYKAYYGGTYAVMNAYIYTQHGWLYRAFRLAQQAYYRSLRWRYALEKLNPFAKSPPS